MTSFRGWHYIFFRQLYIPSEHPGVFAGVVDSGYRGEIKVILYNAGEENYLVKTGDKIAQMIIEKCFLWDVTVVNELNNSERGSDGFGSSGK